MVPAGHNEEGPTVGEQSNRQVNLRYGNAPQRRKILVDLVWAKGFCSSSELGEALQVSEMTVRRDIQVLAKSCHVLGVHGGAAAPPEAARATMSERLQRRLITKTQIGHEAAALVDSDSVVGFDSGTTVLGVVEAMCQLSRLPLVLTNSVPVLHRLSQIPSAHVVSLGGVLNQELGMLLLGDRAPAAESMRLDQFFLGASAVRDGALFCGTSADARTKSVLLDIADEVVLVADSSKFVDAKKAMSMVTKLETISRVVTDWEIEDATVTHLESLGISVHVATQPHQYTDVGRGGVGQPASVVRHSKTQV
jgi:DeoR/GlpR family transcriptional regulator of sugar metabolism